MRSIAALVAALAVASAGDHCSDIQSEFMGWTQKTTNGVTFTNFPGSYSFQTQGYDKSGNCISPTVNANGGIAPLNDGTHFVFRGPLELKNFAVYKPSGGAKAKRDAHAHGHSHQHFHEKRKYGDKVTANINGKEVEMTDTWSPQGGAGGAPAAPAAGGSPGGGNGAKAPAAQDQAAAPTVNVPAGAWGRVAHYAAQGANGPESDGLTFLMAQKYSDSVSFFSASNGGLVYSPTHQNLAAGVTVPDDTEFYIASNAACTDDTCPMRGPNVTAYQGFSGQRLAVFEFQMPLSGSRKCDTYNTPNPDMPCVWALSSHIVNNLQYGNCNGWKAGSGEYDIVEVLKPGSSNMFASMHMGSKYAGTEGDALVRPTDKTMKLAVLFADDKVHQQVLTDFAFGASVDGGDVQAVTGGGAGAGSMKIARGSSVMALNQNVPV